MSQSVKSLINKGKLVDKVGFALWCISFVSAILGVVRGIVISNFIAATWAFVSMTWMLLVILLLRSSERRWQIIELQEEVIQEQGKLIQTLKNKPRVTF